MEEEALTEKGSDEDCRGVRRDIDQPAVHDTPSHAHQHAPDLIHQPELRINLPVRSLLNRASTAPVGKPPAAHGANNHGNAHSQKASTDSGRRPLIPDRQLGGKLHGNGKVCRVQHGRVEGNDADGRVAEQTPVALESRHGGLGAAFPRGREGRGEGRGPEEGAALLVQPAAADASAESLGEGKEDEEPECEA